VAAAPGAAADEPPATTPEVDAPGTGDVLVVEDDAHVRRIVVETLSSRGYTVTEAANGREALEATASRAHAPALVVTDVIMPGMAGRELVQRLRERWPDVRVLFTTAYVADETAGHASNELPGAILRKPFVPAELGAAVREAVLAPAKHTGADVAADAGVPYLADASKGRAVGSSDSGS
jgi:CheY-like chemotaxis protein